MTDIISRRGGLDGGRRTPGGADAATPWPLEGSAEDGTAPIDVVELLFFAYRDFTGEADAVLAQFGFGRAHHRVLHFVHRHPGLRVADLLDVLKITKQSLARVLKQLVDDGYVEQSAGTSDRRERRLKPTAKGTALAAELDAIQGGRIAAALEEAGRNAPEIVRQFLFAMIAEADRPRVAELLAAGSPGGTQARGADDR